MQTIQNKTQHTISDPIAITVNNSYKVVDWEKAIITRCLEDNPSSTLEEVAEMLGLSDRTFSRRIRDLNIKTHFRGGKHRKFSA